MCSRVKSLYSCVAERCITRLRIYVLWAEDKLFVYTYIPIKAVNRFNANRLQL